MNGNFFHDFIKTHFNLTFGKAGRKAYRKRIFVMDNDPCQTSRKAMPAILGTEHARGSPEHAQSQGQVERQNQLFANIRAVCNRNPASWPRAMHAVTFAHNTSVNRTTGVSPQELVFKQQARRPKSFLLPKNPEKDDEWIPGTIKDTANAGQTR